MAQMIPKPAQGFSPIIAEMAQRYGVSPAMIGSIIGAESSGNAGAIGPATRYGRAQGLMQVMPGTYGDLAASQGLGPDAMDPRNNIQAGTAYFQQMMDQFGDPETALIAYNWGPGNTQKWIASGRDPNRLPAETRAYVAKVMQGSGGSALQTDAGGGMAGATQLAPMPAPTNIAGQGQPMPPEAMQTAAGMGDMLSQSPGDLLNVNDVPPDDPLAAYRTKAKGQALLDAGAALLAASGWSARPISMGEALGGAVKAGTAAYQGTMDQALKDQYMQSQIAAMDRKGAGMGPLLAALGVPGADGGTMMQTAAGGGGGAAAAPGASAIPTPEVAAGGGGAAPAGGDGSLYSQLNPTQQKTLLAIAASGDLEKVTSYLADLSTREGGGKYRDATAEEKAQWGYDTNQPVQVNDVTGERKVTGESATQVRFTRADKLRDEFQKTTAFQNYNVVAPFYNEIMAASQTPGGLNDVSMLYSFIKLLDPGSVVKQDEVRLSNSAAPGSEQVALIYQKLTKGGALTPTELEQLPQIAKRLYDDRKKALDSTASYYESLGKDFGVKRSDIVAPWLEGAPAVQAIVGAEDNPGLDPNAAPPMLPADPAAAPVATPPVAEPTTPPAPEAKADPWATPMAAKQGVLTVESMNAMKPGAVIVVGGKEYVKKQNGNWDLRFPAEGQIPAGQ